MNFSIKCLKIITTSDEKYNMISIIRQHLISSIVELETYQDI